VRLEGLGQLKKSNDLPACSIVPQPITLPRASLLEIKWTEIKKRFPHTVKHMNSCRYMSIRIIPLHYIAIASGVQIAVMLLWREAKKQMEMEETV
jgi:hypothetical protein